MKKLLFLFFSLFILTAGGILFYNFFLRKSEKGALQITSNLQSKIYIDSVYKGTTPLCFCPKNGELDEKNIQEMLPVGNHTVRLVPEERSLPEFQENITLEKGVLSVIDRKFAEGASSEGFVISLSDIHDPTSNELSVLSIPDEAEVLLDNVEKGKTPLQLKNLTISDHILTLRKPGYKSKTIRIRSVNNYKLLTKGYLGIDLSMIAGEKSTASSSATPIPQVSVTKVLILQTGTGFLRVRDSNSLGGKEIAQVTPGEKYTLLDEQTGWYQIELGNGSAGWISSQYAEKMTE
ncbi:MAG: PEGA domain-containing protein [bacterium]|nr:PEGA domain-containing protein [bacterium]